MTSFTPSFLFDFSFLYMFSGFDSTQLLFIGLIVLLCNLYFHMSLSKKHLLFSFPLTLLLLSGIGIRVATSTFSFNFVYHYIIFSFLLLVLVIDHRLYLFIPDDYQTPLDKTKLQVEKVALPAFNTVHPQIPRSQGLSSIFQTLARSVDDIKNGLTSKLGIDTPQPTTVSANQKKEDQYAGLEEYKQKDISKDEPFVHPLEKDADSILTTKQMLREIKTQSLDHLDLKIDETKLSDESFLDSFLDDLSKQRICSISIDDYDFSSLVNQIDESAIIMHRGVIKAANNQFSSLVKQPIVDILDKDFIYFLAPEGYASFKDHCSKRLSGESSENFDVVLLSKKHEKILLQAQIKSRTVNGEPIEITIFQKLNT